MMVYRTVTRKPLKGMYAATLSMLKSEIKGCGYTDVYQLNVFYLKGIDTKKGPYKQQFKVLSILNASHVVTWCE